MFYEMVKSVSIDILEFLALVMGILFSYFKMNSFIYAAIALGYVNGQTLSYLAFAVLLIVLPIVLMTTFKKHSKCSALRKLFYAYGTVIIYGTVCDLISYNCFMGYNYMEGDTVFVNMMWNMPNLWGVVISAIVAFLYFALGKQIKRKRRVSYALYIAIFVVSHLPAMIYSYLATGTLPRDTYLEKSVYVMALQLLIIGALTLAVTSRSLWKKHVWY